MPESIFSEAKHTHGEVPHLLQYLWDNYAAWMREELDKREKAGKAVVALETALQQAPATHFVKWASKYLQEHRAIEVSYMDANCGIRLTNNAVVAISPGVDAERGTMQEANAINITEGRSPSGTRDVINTQTPIDIT